MIPPRVRAMAREMFRRGKARLRRHLKLVAVLGLLLNVAAAVVLLWLFFHNPHMRHQPSIKPAEAVLPELPSGAVPVTPPDWPAPSQEQARGLRNPLAPTPENLARGEVFYGYYCRFCHGDDGRGNGPVGRSFVPTPPDLTAGGLSRYGDGELLRRMLSGQGHAPVLERVVHEPHRWYIVLHVRHLASQTPGPSTLPSPQAKPAAPGVQ